MSYEIEAEIDRNYSAFQDMLDDLLPRSEGQYALLRDQELKGVYSTPAQAEIAGHNQFADERYSIQLVSREPVDLGFYSYGYNQG